MKVNHKNFKLRMPSITDDKNIIYNNQSQSLSLHDVEEQYLILSYNEFRTVNNVGYFNKKTDFRIGEEKSIIVLDNNLNIIPDIKTSEITKNQYIIYPMPYKYLTQNQYFFYDFFDTNKTIRIPLNFEFGEKIGNILLNLANNKDNEQTKEDIIFKTTKDYPIELFNLFISWNNYGYSINKNLLINSNPEFLLGILNATTTNIFYNINIYTYTTILNYLGAMYSITRDYKDSRKLNYFLPEEFKTWRLFPKISNPLIKFKNDTRHKENILKNINEEFKDIVINSKIWKSFINNEILLIKTEDLQFVKLGNKSDMYDYTMQLANATTFTPPFGPMLKNSDGDILGLIGIFGKESLQEAKEFSPERKDYFRSFNDGEIQNWITKDAVLGLYNTTKTISK
jgi:hypothetical protein